MGWSVVLSNNEIVKQNESDVTSWRQLVEKARSKNLKIRSITFDGKDPHPNVPLISYFVIYEFFVPDVVNGGESQHLKIGIGGLYSDKVRSRIRWYKVQGNPVLYTEIIQKTPEGYKEVMIDRE